MMAALPGHCGGETEAKEELVAWRRRRRRKWRTDGAARESHFILRSARVYLIRGVYRIFRCQKSKYNNL